MPKIDKRLLPMKAHYFLFNAGTAPVVPFMPTLAKQLGFSSVVVGTIYTILPITGMLAKPLFGIFADKFQRHKLLFLIFQLLTAVAFFCIMFIPSIPQSSTVELDCHGGASFLKFCPLNTEIDKCIKDRLENKFQNSKVPCQLHCNANESIWKVICEKWIGTSDCQSKEPTFDMTVFIAMNQLELPGLGLDKTCLFFRVHQGEIFGKNTTMYCPTNDPDFKTNCNVTCNDPYIKDTLSEAKVQNRNVIGLYQFWLLFIFLIISWAGMAVVVSVGDAICFEMLGDRHYLYGNQRLWGAVGWGIFSVISGALVDKLSGDSINKDYTVVFYMTLVIISLDIFASMKLEHSTTKLSTNILKDVGTIFMSVRVVIFFIWCIVVGLCTALIWNFLFWHLEELGGCNDQQYMKSLQGLAMGIQCFGGELPFFFLSGWILKKIGHINAMSIVLLGFGVRFLLYSALTNPWWVLPIELLNGVTFGIFYSTMASYASIVAPPGTEATLQGLVGAIFEGVGVSIGSFVGGFLFQSIGGRQTFFLFGVCAISAFVLHALIQWLLEKYGGKHGLTAAYETPGDAMHMLDDQEITYNMAN